MPVADIPNRPAPDDDRDIVAILDNFDALILIINALDGANIEDGAITNAKLAGNINPPKIGHATAGSLMVGQTAGTYLPHALSNDVSINEDGVAKVHIDYFEDPQGFNTNLPIDGSTYIGIDNLSRVLPAGTWKVTARVHLVTVNASPRWGARLLYGFAPVDGYFRTVSSGGYNEDCIDLEAIIVTSGTVSVSVQATATLLTGTPTTSGSWMHCEKLDS